MTPADPIEAATEADRLWFEAHPRRQHRIRPYIPGELPEAEADPVPPGWRRFMAVRQIAPGMRARMFFAAEGQPGTSEQAAARLCDLLLGGAPRAHRQARKMVRCPA